VSVGQQPERQVAFERHGGQALAEQVVEVAGHPEPLAADR
jgi:hypothetical protein